MANYQKLTFFANEIVNDLDTAENITNDCFKQLWGSRRDLKDKDHIRSYLYSIAKSRVIDHLRVKSNEENATEKFKIDESFVEAQLIETLILDRIINNINQLPPRKRKIFELSIVKNLSTREIARILTISEQSVRNTLGLARKKLKTEFIGLDDHTQTSSNSSPIKIVDQINDLITYLAKHPSEIYHLCPRKFEELVAELLKNMGYEIYLMQPTRDGGRDIIAAINVPPKEKLVMLVQCKRNNANNKVGIDVVERFLFTIREKDKANVGWIVTTSSFSSGAKRLQEQYKWQLSLKDSKHLEEWCGQHGQWMKSSGPGGLWLPNNPLA